MAVKGQVSEYNVQHHHMLIVEKWRNILLQLTYSYLRINWLPLLPEVQVNKVKQVLCESIGNLCSHENVPVWETFRKH